MLAVNQQIQGILNTGMMGRESGLVLTRHTSTLRSALVAVMEIIDGQEETKHFSVCLPGRNKEFPSFTKRH